MGMAVVLGGNSSVKATSTIPRRQATVSLDNKTPKCSLDVHLQSYQLALAKKEQLATASGNYDSTQSETPIPVMRKSEPIRQKISGSATRNVSNQIVAFWVFLLRVLVGHIIREMIVGYLLT